MLSFSFLSQLDIISLKKRLWHSSLIIAGVGLAVLGGVSPHYSLETGLILQKDMVFAQSYNNQELMNYARAVFEIEQLRNNIYQEIKDLMPSGQVPEIVCNQPASINPLDVPVRSLVVGYCTDSATIVRRNNLSIDRFNQITKDLEVYPSLKTQVQNLLITIQQENEKK